MGIAINIVIIYYVTRARDTEVRYILKNMLSPQLMHHKKQMSKIQLDSVSWLLIKVSVRFH